MKRIIAGFLAGTLPGLWGQTALSLQEAIKIGLEKHPSVEASVAGERAARSRIQAARSGYLPKANYTESVTRSDNPVFVFGSLLTEHQFTAGNFALGPLNRPDFLNNFQSLVTVDQMVYDGGGTKSQVRAAELGTQVAAEGERGTRMGVVAGVAGAYFGAVLAKERLNLAQQAMRSAEADLKRAENVRAAGMSTDADVLSVRVHLADVRQQEIEAKYGIDVALAALNEALGLPLETAHDLSTPLTAAKLPDTSPEALGSKAVGERPDSRQASLSVQVADAQSAVARSALLPRISVRSAFETDRQTFATKGGANWLFSASLSWNFFNGFADKSRREEAEQSAVAARAEQKRADAQARLQVHSAYAQWKAAQERIEVATAAVAMAEESLRITRNRYEAGLTTVTDLLQNETAWLRAKTHELDAIYGQRHAAAALEFAAGILSGDSDAVK